ncbi:MAG: glycine oxidase ThiO [Beijerinckiaceae bacterium]|nr:glycine oxidase ThiO [Beijerinckiaceae bacterium]
MKFTVIGAGVAGLTTALALATRGATVEVLERGASIGAESCSRFAGGMLAPWCEAESAEELVVSLGVESLSYWPQRAPHVVARGSLVLALQRDGADLDRFARRTRNSSLLDADAIAALEPDLAGRFRRGIFFADEAHLDPRAALPALAEALHARGSSLTCNVEVRPNDIDGDHVIDCRGLAARDALPDLRGVKGEMLIVHCPDVTLTRPVRLVHPRFPLYIVPRGDNVYMIGATMVESSERGRVTARAMVELLNAAYALHPAFAEAEIMEIGCDARPAFPDNLPRIRRNGRVLHVNGLYRHGFLLSPALARMAAAVALDNAYFPEVMDEHRRQRTVA